MLAAVESLDGILRRLQKPACAGGWSFVGRTIAGTIVAIRHAAVRAGADARPARPCHSSHGAPKGLRTTETLRRFTVTGKRAASGNGRYLQLHSNLNWAVVAHAVWTRPAKMRRYGVERPGAQFVLWSPFAR